MLLEIKNLSGGYGRGDIVKGITCQADGGEILCVLGPNGCGKTTFFRLLFGMLPPTAGEVYMDGKRAVPQREGETGRLHSPEPYPCFFLHGPGAGDHGAGLPFFRHGGSTQKGPGAGIIGS